MSASNSTPGRGDRTTSLTLTVFEVGDDGTTRKVSTTTTTLNRDTTIPEPSPIRWPPCRCPLHRPGVVLEKGCS